MMYGRINMLDNIHLRSDSEYTLNYYESQWVEKQLKPTHNREVASPTLIFQRNNQSIPIEGEGAEVIRVYQGETYGYKGNNTYEINPLKDRDFVSLLKDLKMRKLIPKQILYLWTMEDVGLNYQDFLALVKSEDFLLSTVRSLQIGVYAINRLLTSMLELNLKEVTRILVFYKTKEESYHLFYDIMGSYGRSLGYLLPKLRLSTVEIRDERLNNHIIDYELYDKAYDREIRYVQNKRYVKKISPVDLIKNTKIVFKKGATYLITGGAGGLGLIFAKYLAKAYQSQLVLVGRSALNEEKQNRIQELKELGSHAVYWQADVSNIESMRGVIKRAKKEFGHIDGAIHGAGLVSQLMVNEKNLEEFQSIMAPKIKGTLVLDEVTKEEPLDFLILFSSTASILGDFGQCDYSIGNRFLDGYGHMRQQLQQQGGRSGRAIIMNWPLWKEGGMHQHEETEKFYLKSSSMDYLKTEDGIEAFENIIGSGLEQVMVIYGNKKRVGESLGVKKGQDITLEPEQTLIEREKNPYTWKKGEFMEHTLEKDIKKIAAEILKIKPGQIDSGVNIGEYGFDSISLITFADKMNEAYKTDISPTLFFSVNTVTGIAKHLMDNREDQVEDTHRDVEETLDFDMGKWLNKEIPYLEPLKNQLSHLSRFQDSRQPILKAKADEPVAIIGIDGIFPRSKDLHTFWKNLEGGKDLITKIPLSRWDWREHYSEDPRAKNKAVSNSGGFIEDVDKFDASFFNISPREAELMDPQQRLLLQTIWKATEDAGYRASSLGGRNIGVFVGFQFSDYQELLEDLDEFKPQIPTGNSHAVLANRISYFMNLRGPSESIDTACSSSLVAIHRAVSSIQSGESEMAYAGGVSLMLSYKTFLSASKLGILSVDNRCKTFDKSANGYVRGEGIGMLLLKPLSQAIKDNDYIYAVIKGSAENHGGRANSLTAPNSDAQAALLVSAYKKAQIPPDTITYVEAHGTGTALGDPIEIDGLKKAFKELYNIHNIPKSQHNYCGIGSVKTNIGHLEPASGIAGVMKVVLALQHKKLPASLNFKEQNPYIQLDESPFYIVKETKDWQPLMDYEGHPIPRRAGVSSFGFGGSNAHIVLEEYKQNHKVYGAKEPQIVILSAKDKEALQESAKELLHYLTPSEYHQEATGYKYGEDKVYDLESIAYTLQVGREPMGERLALIVETVEELRDSLQQFIKGQIGTDETIWVNSVKYHQRPFSLFYDDEDAILLVRQWINKRKLDKIANLWVSGYDVDWNLLHGQKVCCRVPLPTYPFKKERYWVPKHEPSRPKEGVKNYGSLLDSIEYSQTLDLGIVFTKKIDNHMAIIGDHLIKEQHIFPGVGYLEMAYEAAKEISGNSDFDICRVYWLNPFILNKSEDKIIMALKKEGDKIIFQVKDPQDSTIYVKGEIHGKQDLTLRKQSISIEEIKERCTHIISGDSIYEEYEKKGIHYGPFFRGITQVYKNEEEALGVLELSSNRESGLQGYTLHPTLLDSALQIIGCIRDSGDKVFLPFALERIEEMGPLQKSMYAYVKTAGPNSYNLALMDEKGHICFKLYNYAIKEIKEPLEDLSYQLNWKEVPLVPHRINDPQEVKEESVFIIYTDDSHKAAQRIALHYSQSMMIKLGNVNKTYFEGHKEVKYDDPTAIGRVMAEISHLDKVYFLCGIHHNPLEPSIQEAQEKGVLSLFRLIKVLESKDLLQRGLKLKIITNNVYGVDNSSSILPVAASIHGFVKSLAKEYSKLEISCIDIDIPRWDNTLDEDVMDTLIEPIFHEPKNPHGETVVYRNKRRYQRQIEALPLPAAKESIFREKGVYIIVGGAGGIGLELSRYLSKKVKARLFLIGRSKLSGEKEAIIKEIEALGGVVMYHQGDMTNEESMQKAIGLAKSHFGNINGVFHSAIVSADKTIQNMGENELYESLAPKIWGSTILYSMVQEEPLDFLAFFSSTSSVVGMPGQSNYVSGLNFKDTFAHYIQGEASYPIKVFNWGFWGIGSSEGEEYGKRLKRQGIHEISPEEGMEIIERVLSQPVNQVFILKAQQHVFETLGVEKIKGQSIREDVLKDRKSGTITKIPYEVESSSSTMTQEHGEVTNQDMLKEQLDSTNLIMQEAPTERSHSTIEREEIMDYLKKQISQLLKMDIEKIDSHTSFEQMGIDSLLSLEFHANLEKNMDDLPPTLLFDHTNLEELVGYFFTNHQGKINSIIAKDVKKSGEEDLFVKPMKPQEKYVNQEVNGSLPVSLDSFLVEIDPEVSVEVCIKGAGDPLLIIPGFAVTMLINTYQIEELSKYYKVISMNLPGHGKTHPIDDLTFSGISTMMMKVLDKLGITQPLHVIGGSFGGMIAQNIASEFPNRVRSLTLFASFTLSKFEGVSQYFSFVEAVAKDFEMVKITTDSKEIMDNVDKCFELYKKSQVSNSTLMLKYLDLMKQGMSTRHLLEEIKAPTLVMVGAVDSVIDTEESRFIHSSIKGSQYVEIPDGGHFINLTHHNLVGEKIKRFLEGYENSIEEQKSWKESAI